MQVGAFKDRDNAERLRARLDAEYPPASIEQVALEDGAFYRVRVGKIAGEQTAQKFADTAEPEPALEPDGFLASR